MKFEEMGLETGKTLLLLPGTACTWQINFAMVIDDLKQRYHLICVNYDGFDGDSNKPFTDMITVTEKIEASISRFRKKALPRSSAHPEAGNPRSPSLSADSGM